MLSRRELITVDTECYVDYWLLKIRQLSTGKLRKFELYEDLTLDVATIEKILRKYCIVTFNGNSYDVPMMTLALTGANNRRLKAGSDAIIVGKLKPWEFENTFGIRRLRYIDQIDLIDITPGSPSLKVLGARMHSIKLQDLPIDPSASISPDQRPVIDLYCGNDLQTNVDLFEASKDKLDLRVKLGKQYGLDLRSKSNAQIAEAVIKAEIEKLSGEKIKKPDQNYPSFKYVAPHFISFTTEVMRKTLALVEASQFHVFNGKVELPDQLEGYEVKIGKSTYRMGIGGLHSSEENAAHFSDDDHILIDRDVASYYPMLILVCGLFPKHLGKKFLRVLRKIVNTRLKAKKDWQAAEEAGLDFSEAQSDAESLKIVVNSCFGKFGNKWSSLFSPDLLIQTTLTGQLALLMLIEHLESEGIPVVSANTDGVVIRCPKAKYQRYEDIIKAWEFDTGLDTEATYYSAIYSRDVNNYIAIKTNGSVKLKGAYTKPGLAKNPNAQISVEAATKYITDKIPLEETIFNCKDIRKFLCVRKVDGGAVVYDQDILAKNVTQTYKKSILTSHGWEHHQGKVWKQETFGEYCYAELDFVYEDIRVSLSNSNYTYLGKVVRWYYSTDARPPLRYKTNGNKVADSDNSKEMMDLVEGIPVDIDFERYRNIAVNILIDIGALPKPPKVLTERQQKAKLKKLMKALDDE